jgi:hypothetical protein
VATTIRFTHDDAGKATFRGQFAGVTDLEALDMSVLGRDILNLFALIVDVLVREDGAWQAFLCINAEATVQQILEAFAAARIGTEEHWEALAGTGGHLPVAGRALPCLST